MEPSANPEVIVNTSNALSTFLLSQTPVHLIICANIKSANHLLAATQSFRCRYKSGASVYVQQTSEWGQKYDLSDFDCGLIVGSRWLVSIFKPLNSCDFHAQQSLEYTQNGAISSKHPVSRSLVNRKVRGEWPDWLKLNQIITLYNCGQKEYLRMHTSRRLNWVLLNQEEKHEGVDRLTKTGQLKTGIM